jgi:hypothetical protein
MAAPLLAVGLLLLPTVTTAPCSPHSLEAGTAVVDAACCGDPWERCPKGVPNFCDADCAAVFPAFWGQCGATLTKTFLPPVEVADFERLVGRCRDAPERPSVLFCGRGIRPQFGGPDLDYLIDLHEGHGFEVDWTEKLADCVDHVHAFQYNVLVLFMSPACVHGAAPSPAQRPLPRPQFPWQ